MRELEEGAWLRFKRLGGTQDGWHALEKAVREWMNTKNSPPPNGRISLEEVRRVAIKAYPVSLHTFLSPTAFFARYLEPQPHRLFHHRLPQVGRRAQINDLLRFAEGNSQIALLPGRGGSGKSKLVHTLCRRLARRSPDQSVRLVAENLAIKESALDELPDDSSLIIVDDAHRVEGVEGLEVLLAAARQNPNLKVLLVTRPHATDYLTAQVRNAGFDRNDIVVIEPLPDLNYAHEHRRLARFVLGRGQEHYADKLARITRDCPLLTVVGGQLLRTKQVTPSFLVHNDTFRQEVLSRFRDIQFGEIISHLSPRFTQQLCADVLPLVAVMTPLHLEHTPLLQAMAQLAGTNEIHLKQLLDALVEAGALVRGGRLVRIVPDVLSDFILHEACFTRYGAPTGWAERVYQTVADAGLHLDAILRNLAELDWRVRTAPPSVDPPPGAVPGLGAGLLDAIWRDIADRFRASSLDERKAWLGRLERIAFMQPHRLWPLVEIARNEPVPENPDKVSPALKPWLQPTTQASVLTALGPILRGVAYDERFTARCADLLWEMGRDLDTKPGSSSSAMEALRQLASYENHKPLVFSHIVLECCRGWMSDPHVHAYRHSVLEVLSPMLARRVNWTEMRGRWLRDGSFILPSDPLPTLRRGALGLVERCALSGILPVVLEALHTLHAVLSEQGLWELREQEPAEWNAWEAEHQAALEIVARVADTNDDPFVRLRIWEEVHWQAERGPRAAVQSRAREILNALPHTFESRFILLVTRSHGEGKYRRTWESPEETDSERLDSDQATRDLIDQKRYQRDTEFAGHVTREWVERHPDPREGFDAFSEWIGRIETSGWWKMFWTRSNPFMVQLATDFPAYARAWCEIALEQPEAHATGKCEDLLCELRRQDPATALELAQRFLASEHPNLWLRVAASYSRPGWPQNPLPEEWQIVRDLLAFPHPQIKRRAASIVASIAAVDAGYALELVLETEIGGDSQLAEKLYEIFDERRKFDIMAIGADKLEQLLDKLSPVESVRSYYLERFLLRAALCDPVAVARLLLGRVRHKIRLKQERLNALAAKEDHSPVELLVDAFNELPEAGFHDEKFEQVVDHPGYPSALRLIRDAALGDDYRSALMWEDTLPELFRDFSLNFGPISLDVLNEWINSGDCTKVQAARNLLEDTYLGFYLGNASFVSNYLRQAQECGSNMLEEVERAMLGYAEFGPPRAAASLRGERSNALFHGAVKALDEVRNDPLMTRFFQKLRDRGEERIRSEMQEEAEEEIYFRS